MQAVQAWIIGYEQSVWLGQKWGLSSKDCSQASTPPSATDFPSQWLLSPTSWSHLIKPPIDFLSKLSLILSHLQKVCVCSELNHCLCNLHSLKGGWHAHALGNRGLDATVLFYKPVSIRVITLSRGPRTWKQHWSCGWCFFFFFHKA